MGAVAWGALVTAVACGALAIGLERWRRGLPAPAAHVVDLTAFERSERDDAVAFDGIVGHLLLADPGFADTTERLARLRDDDPAA